MASRSAANRPFKYGAKDRREFIVSDGEVSIRAQNDGSGNAIYIGKAKVGTLTSEAKWQVSFQVYDGNNAITSRTWPQNDEGNASSEYEFVWDDRAGFVYS
jgi:hypothetical protein